MLNGFILINKEKGITSQVLVNKVKKILNIKKAGHSGVLDISAGGLMVVGLNNGCKLFKYLENHTKTYIAHIIFGITTDTLDIKGKILDKKNYNFSRKELINAIEKIKQQKTQVPPLCSNIKVNGKRLMEYQRKKENVEIRERETRLINYNIVSFNDYELEIELKTEKGYYVRSFARDLGQALNTYGIIKELNRTKIEDFKLEDSYKIEDLENNNYKILKIEDVVKLEKIELESRLEKLVLNGAKLNKSDVRTHLKEFYFIKNNHLISIYKYNEETEKYEQQVFLNENN